MHGVRIPSQIRGCRWITERTDLILLVLSTVSQFPACRYPEKSQHHRLSLPWQVPNVVGPTGDHTSVFEQPASRPGIRKSSERDFFLQKVSFAGSALQDD